MFLVVCSARCRNSASVLGIANAFSGGIFIAIALVHILPEATSTYAEIKEEEKANATKRGLLNEDDDDDFFPWPFVIVFFG